MTLVKKKKEREKGKNIYIIIHDMYKHDVENMI